MKALFIILVCQYALTTVDASDHEEKNFNYQNKKYLKTRSHAHRFKRRILQNNIYEPDSIENRKASATTASRDVRYSRGEDTTESFENEIAATVIYGARSIEKYGKGNAISEHGNKYGDEVRLTNNNKTNGKGSVISGKGDTNNIDGGSYSSGKGGKGKDGNISGKGGKGKTGKGNIRSGKGRKQNSWLQQSNDTNEDNKRMDTYLKIDNP
mmetsp:Transcript_29609/g.36051  ORF Transcript_29609/g.36051 Transcript_29609/m.36051 type:complete len:211 (-) Transcript_29609:192-824(-)